MRLVVEVADERLVRFRAAVTAEGKTQAEVIREAIESYIRTVERRNKDADKQVGQA